MALGLEKGVDLYRAVTFSCQFDLAHPSRCVLLPTAESSSLIDVFISVRGACDPYLMPLQRPLSAPHDVHIYLLRNDGGRQRSTDLTPDYIQLLQAELDRLPADQLALAYQSGLENWFAVNKYVSTSSDASAIAQDKARAEQLVRLRPCSRWLTSLGNRDEGRQGTLHVFNFLYEWLPVQPVSLAATLQAHAKRVGEPSVMLDSVSLPRLVFSAGPLGQPPATTPSGMNFPVGGCLEGVLECAFGNELAKEFVDMQDKVRRDLLDVRSRLRNTGPLMQTVMTLGDQVARVLEELAEAEALLADQKLQLATIRQDLKLARAKIDELA
jgi:hypothetical protein